MDESESVVVEVSGEMGGVDNLVCAFGAGEKGISDCKGLALEGVFDVSSLLGLILAVGE